MQSLQIPIPIYFTHKKQITFFYICLTTGDLVITRGGVKILLTDLILSHFLANQKPSPRLPMTRGLVYSVALIVNRSSLTSYFQYKFFLQVLLNFFS